MLHKIEHIKQCHLHSIKGAFERKIVNLLILYSNKICSSTLTLDTLDALTHGTHGSHGSLGSLGVLTHGTHGSLGTLTIDTYGIHMVH